VSNISNIIAGMRGFNPFDAIEQNRQRQMSIKASDLIDRQRDKERAFERDFIDMGYTQGVSNPAEISDLYSEHFPLEFAKMQMKQQYGGSADPYALEKLKLRQDAEGRRAGQQALESQKIGISKDRVQLLEEKQKFYEKMGNAKLSKEVRDELFREKKYQADEQDRSWKNEWSKNKTTYEYAQKQVQLAGQIPSGIRGNYRGTIVGGGENSQDLTPLAVKEIVGATEGVSKILRSTDKLYEMVGKNGLQVLPGKEKAKMETLLSDMALTYKGEDFAGLGVLTGPDLDILLNIMGDPTKLSGMSAEIQKTKLNEFREMLIDGYNKKLDSRGFNPVDANSIKSIGGNKAVLSAEDEALID